MAFSDLVCIRIESDEEGIELRKSVYLRAAGWEHTSNTIGSYWMWCKEIEGRHYGCSLDNAFRIQSTIDRHEYATAHPTEFED